MIAVDLRRRAGVIIFHWTLRRSGSFDWTVNPEWISDIAVRALPRSKVIHLGRCGEGGIESVAAENPFSILHGASALRHRRACKEQRGRPACQPAGLVSTPEELLVTHIAGHG
jgi:hypothetical protein